MVEQGKTDGRTTVQVIQDWRARMLYSPRQTRAERILDYSLPVLWALALFVAAAAIFW